MYNKLLLRQIQKNKLDLTNIPDEIRHLLKDINESYEHYEKDRKMLERSIELSSQEMKSMYEQLQTEIQESLKTAKELKTIFANIDEAYLSIDMLTGKIIQQSPAFSKISGYSIEKFKDDQDFWLKLVLPEDQHIIESCLEKLKKGNNCRDIYRIRHSEGNIRWTEAKLTPQLNNENELIRIDGTISDITDKILADQRIAEGEKRFKLLIENSQDGFILTDKNGKCTYASPSVEKVIGLAPDNQENVNLLKLVHPEDLQKTLGGFLEMLSKKTNRIEYTIRILCKDGTYRWFESVSQDFFNVPGIESVLSNFHDITDRVINQSLLEAQNEALSKSNHELDRFVYSVSHDLRAPLTAVQGIIDISLEETEDDLMITHLGMMKESILKLDQFILDILDYSKNNRTEAAFEKISLRPLMESITSHLKYMGADKREVAIELDMEDDLEIETDKNRITMVMNNLVSNAIRYQNYNIPNPFVRVKAKKSADATTIIIEDNGIGISSENHQKIFDIFYRVSEQTAGSGLGLYIVKEAIQKMKGQITLESCPGKGSTFKIVLPASATV